MLSQKAKYALRALLVLAQVPRGETVLISEIAATHQHPDGSFWSRSCLI